MYCTDSESKILDMNKRVSFCGYRSRLDHMTREAKSSYKYGGEMRDVEFEAQGTWQGHIWKETGTVPRLHEMSFYLLAENSPWIAD